jgi:hypothetical protein
MPCIDLEAVEALWGSPHRTCRTRHAGATIMKKAIERENSGAAGLVKLIPAAVRDAGRYKLAIVALI